MFSSRSSYRCITSSRGLYLAKLHMVRVLGLVVIVRALIAIESSMHDISLLNLWRTSGVTSLGLVRFILGTWLLSRAIVNSFRVS